VNRLTQVLNSDTVAPKVPWPIIIAGCLIAALTFGPRSAMGFFQLPMITETGFDRATFGLAMAIQNLVWGLGQPLFGALADRFGTWRVYVMSMADTAGLLYLSGGVMVGLGIAAGSFGIVLAAFARNVAPDNRSFVFGVGTAAGSAGMFLFAPYSQALINAYGWSHALVILSAMMLVIPLLAIPLRGNAMSGTANQQTYQQTARQALSEAFGHQGYVLLIAGFFVCGFQVAFITAHFPAYISDLGLEPRYAVIGLALIGFFNIIGSLGSGFFGQRYPKPYILSFIYISRSITVTAFLLLPKTPTSVVVFSIVMGLLWLSTVAPTNGLVAVMFGTRHLGMLSGTVFLSHQIGSFLGIWLGGKFYDMFGSYDPVWWLGVALGLCAAAVHWPIKEAAIMRPTPNPVPV
jgi:MFS family permease